MLWFMIAQNSIYRIIFNIQCNRTPFFITLKRKKWSRNFVRNIFEFFKNQIDLMKMPISVKFSKPIFFSNWKHKLYL